MSKALGIALLGGGGLWLAYEMGWLCGYGFGPSCAAATPAAAPPATPAPAPAAPSPAPTTTPSAPAPGSTPFTLSGPVAPDVNNSVKGLVSIGGGSPVALNCIPPGDIWQGNSDITGQLISQGVDVNGLCSAMQGALQTQATVATGAPLSTVRRFVPLGPRITSGGLPTHVLPVSGGTFSMSGYGMGAVNYRRKSRFR